ncbi:MAG: hypothetical protein HOO96_44440 [Polyangiaceae bacterium]|nr:hypothetical protein [Polyangiaceae bacterium]
MRVDLDASVFQNEPEWCVPLLWFGFVERHRVLVPSASHSAFRLWRQDLAPNLHAAITQAEQWSITAEASSPSKLHVIVASPPVGEQMATTRAWQVLQRPYRLLLEDGVNDRAFLLRMCGVHERAYLRRRFREEWLEADHGGGISSMPRRIGDLAERGEPLQVSCLFDSDAPEPASPSHQANLLREVCVNSRIHHHQLARRAIENYLPRSAFERWISFAPNRAGKKERREAVDALFSAADRHHQKVKETVGAVGHMYADDTAMNDQDLQHEGGPAELGTFIRELIERVQ